MEGGVPIGFDFRGAMAERFAGKRLGHQWDADVWVTALEEQLILCIIFAARLPQPPAITAGWFLVVAIFLLNFVQPLINLLLLVRKQY